MAMDQTFHFQTWRSECIIVLQSLTEWSYTDGHADLKHVPQVQKTVNKKSQEACSKGCDIIF